MTALSDHFLLSEFIKSQAALRLQIDNTPSNEVIENLRTLCVEVIEPVRSHYGIPFTPSSGYRSPGLNQAIGGSLSSQHIKGQAADFEVPGISNKEVAAWIAENCKFDQLILEFHNENVPNSGWIHASYAADNSNRQQVLLYGRTGWTHGQKGLLP
jgi:zinc D-Ala-D-Ala carboxypeptidase